jgi:thimet oligopeptidase
MITPRTAPLLEHRLTPAELAARLDSARAASDAKLARVADMADGERTFANTVDAIEQAVSTFLDAAYRLQILKDVHTDPAVREAAAAAEERASQYGVQVGARRDLYRAVKAYSDGRGRRDELDPQQRRLLELMLREYRRSGLELGDADLAKLVQIRTRLASISTEFQSHLNENTDSIEVSEAELAGLPSAFVARLAKTPSGGRRVTTKYPDWFPFMENARSGEARRRLAVAFNSREAARNTPLLVEAVRLRDEAARLLGYRNHADFVTEDRMAKSGARVKEFLDSLRGKLKMRRDADYAKLLELKRAELDDPSARLEPWDVAYYLNQLKRRDYALDTEQIREYFPAATVLRGMFGVYEELLSIELREVPGADVWSPDVKLYEIRDRPSGELLAYFYSDLYPRPGKYGHAAVAPLNVPRAADGRYVAPVAVLMGNFAPAAGERPSLLSHEEVRTLFHEFGHVMHQTLTVARYGSQAGFNVAGDFVEAPSQMLENWVFEPLVLDRLAGHFQDPARKLPRETIEKMREARMFDAGYKYTRQLWLATFDQVLHTSGSEVDPDAIDRRLYREVLGLEPIPGTHFPATFGHLLGGYDAGYYGYLWSEVFAADMYTRFEEGGVLNPQLGRRYRDTILALGRSSEPDVLLEQFLGRPANDRAFLRKLGVE